MTPLLFGVVGNPVKHSLSPRIHQFWYEKAGINAAYLPLELVTDTPEQDLAALARVGYSGLNITLPYKISALNSAVSVSDAASRIGAANTLTRNDASSDSRAWMAHNTDFTGFLWSLDRLNRGEIRRALIIGAGGAARAVAYGLASRGIKLTLANRTVSNAEDVCRDLGLTDIEITPFDGDMSLAAKL